MSEPAKSGAGDIATLSFEQALAELEQIVGRLESGQAPLEASIAMYERGAALKAHCETRLEAARLRVEKIVVGAGGAQGGAVGVEAAEFS
jgi:exodeoxyribonuclease VII small subunit